MLFHACSWCGAVYLGLEQSGGNMERCRKCQGTLLETNTEDAALHLRGERRLPHRDEAIAAELDKDDEETLADLATARNYAW